LLVLEGGSARRASKRDYAEALEALLLSIPLGKVASYGALSRLLGLHPRAVARLLAENEKAPVVPCHRVVMSSGELGGYSGPGGPSFKRKLLELEGVKFEGEKVARESFFDLAAFLLSPPAPSGEHGGEGEG